MASLGFHRFASYAAVALGTLAFTARVFAFDAAEVARGRYVATAADCEACHTAPGGKAFAGGLPIESPLGTIFSTNITPAKSFGIGGYSLEQFDRALRKGIRADGAHLYPAMPYASYARLDTDDVRSLYAYFSQGVAAVDEAPARKTSLPFPYDMRFSMLFWNALFLDSAPLANDATKSAAWNRGKYLVEGPAHCGECHTPRGVLMQQDRSRDFAGAILGAWYAPNITPDPDAVIGGMSANELFQYLKTGRVAGKAAAGGEMALAVQLSFSRLSDDDLHAIVTYMQSVQPMSVTGAKPRFAQGRATTEVASYRGAGGTSRDALPGGAAQLFAGNCAACHGISAQGSRDAYYPSLFHNSALAVGGGRNLVAAILFGISRSTPDGLAFMPGFGGKPTDIADLNDVQVASLANFLLHDYGDAGDSVSPELVAQVRAGRTPKPPIVLLVETGEWAAGLLALALLAWLAKSRFRRRISERSST